MCNRTIHIQEHCLISSFGLITSFIRIIVLKEVIISHLNYKRTIEGNAKCCSSVKRSGKQKTTQMSELLQMKDQISNYFCFINNSPAVCLHIHNTVLTLSHLSGAKFMFIPVNYRQPISIKYSGKVINITVSIQQYYICGTTLGNARTYAIRVHLTRLTPIIMTASNRQIVFPFNVYEFRYSNNSYVIDAR